MCKIRSDSGLIKDFLLNRMLMTRINKSCSDLQPVKIGVSQGLFATNVNDFQIMLTKEKCSCTQTTLLYNYICYWKDRRRTCDVDHARGPGPSSNLVFKE